MNIADRHVKAAVEEATRAVRILDPTWNWDDYSSTEEIQIISAPRQVGEECLHSHPV